MELVFTKKEENHVEFLIKGERHTFPNLLRSRLLQDKAIVFASYKLAHPMDDDATFIVKTKGKSAVTAVSDACKLVQKDLKSFNAAIKESIK